MTEKEKENSIGCSYNHIANTEVMTSLLVSFFEITLAYF